MTFRVYSAPKGSPDLSGFEKQDLLYKEFLTFDEAMWWAGHLERHNRIALAIEGDDGTMLDRREVGAALGSMKGRMN